MCRGQRVCLRSAYDALRGCSDSVCKVFGSDQKILRRMGMHLSYAYTNTAYRLTRR